MPSVADRDTTSSSDDVHAAIVPPTSSPAVLHLLSDHQATTQDQPAILSHSLWRDVFGQQDIETQSVSLNRPIIAVQFPDYPSPTSSVTQSNTTRLYPATIASQDIDRDHQAPPSIWLPYVPQHYQRRLALSRNQSVTAQVRQYNPVPLSSIILSTSSEDLINHANTPQSTFNSQLDGRIARQADSLILPLGSLTVVQTEPVIQGVITTDTNVVLAFDADAGDEHQSSTHHDGDGRRDSSQHDDFVIDEQFLAQSVLQGFNSLQTTNDDADIDAAMMDFQQPDDKQRTFIPSPISNRQSLIDAISSWRITTTQQFSNSSIDEDSAILLSESGLGALGAFHGDWAIADFVAHGRPRLVRLFTSSELLPSHTACLPPLLLQNLHAPGRFDPVSATLPALRLSPLSGINQSSSSTPLSCPLPIPFADSLTIARIPSALSINRKFQPLFLGALRTYFEGQQRIIKQGDVIAVAVDQGKVRWVKKKAEGHDDKSHQHDSENTADTNEVEPSKFDFSSQHDSSSPSGIVYFHISTLTSELSSPSAADAANGTLDHHQADFELRASARNGDLGAVVDPSLTKMVQTGIVGTRVIDASAWLGVSLARPVLPSTSTPLTSPTSAFGRICQLVQATLMPQAAMYSLHLSVVIKGARGSGKKTAIQWASEKTGVHLIEVNCFDVLGDTDTHTEGVLRARFEAAASCGPAVLVLYNIDALARKSQAVETGQEPAMSNVLRDCIDKLKNKVAATTPYQPVAVFGTTSDAEKCPDGVLACFKHEVTIDAPNEAERHEILQASAKGSPLSPDANLKEVATQTAALVAADLVDLVARARLASVERVKKAFPSATAPSEDTLSIAGIALTGADFDVALSKARANYSESIGAPKIPNVTWDDVGGLASVKSDILDTIQLPLEHPELFSDGLKKRSGILLYGPPGTGKTLLAKAVATSCSLNFFSVKGPELLNMYIGESEANVRRVFQRARDAKPCVIFFDELDSVAPKRGNQGDSGGVMDRIVSQLLAELDGMAGSKEGTDVFVIGATNRPDLLDPALLRPGRFDRMLYLSVSETHAAQLNILQALTRKFKLDPDAGDLSCIAEQCPFNLTGADFYALCSDAMLKAMTRKASEVDEKIASINANPPKEGETNSPHPHPMTPQYYLSELATPEEIQVKVSRADFESALAELVPSVSEQEMGHYRRVQAQFSGPKKESNGEQEQADGVVAGVEAAQAGGTMQDLAEQIMQRANLNGAGNGKGKGKGKAKDVDNEDESDTAASLSGLGAGSYHAPIEAERPSTHTNGLIVPPVNGAEAGGSGKSPVGQAVVDDRSGEKDAEEGSKDQEQQQQEDGQASAGGKGKGKKKDKGKGRA